jgi:hypothetical protein
VLCFLPDETGYGPFATFSGFCNKEWGDSQMSVLSKTLLVVSVSAALAGAAYAQGGEPWVLKQDMGYVVDKDGKGMVVNLNTMKKEDMAKAKAVPRGMVFFMQNGQMMMMESVQR